MTTVIIETAGAALILAAFLLAQRDVVDGSGRPFLTLNLATAAGLAVLAGEARLWAFLLAGALWALLCAKALLFTRTAPEDRRLPLGI
jgi:hypothetical protein